MGFGKVEHFFNIKNKFYSNKKICMFLGSLSSWGKVIKFSYSRSKPSKIILNYIFHLCKTELLFTIKNTNKMALLTTTTTAENSVRRQFASPCWPRYLNNSNQVLILLVPTNLRCFWQVKLNSIKFQRQSTKYLNKFYEYNYYYYFNFTIRFSVAHSCPPSYTSL